MGTKASEELNQQFPKKPKTHFKLGLIGSPFGLKGFVRVKPFSGENEHFFNLKKVTLSWGEKEETREVVEVITQGDTLLLRFSGIDSPEAAGILNGAEIIANREHAAPLKNGEFYVEDLKSLLVIDENGGSLGQITDIVEGGGGNLVEILLSSGEKRLAPFRNEFFGDVDLEKGRIYLLKTWILE